MENGKTSRGLRKPRPRYSHSGHAFPGFVERGRRRSRDIVVREPTTSLRRVHNIIITTPEICRGKTVFVTALFRARGIVAVDLANVSPLTAPSAPLSLALYAFPDPSSPATHYHSFLSRVRPPPHAPGRVFVPVDGKQYDDVDSILS